MSLPAGVIRILKQLGIPPWLFGDSVLVLEGVENATANSVAINAGLINGGAVVIKTPGLYYHDRTLLPESYGGLITYPGVRLRLAPGAACNQIRNRNAQNAVDAVFVSIVNGIATITEKGHSRQTGQQVYIENAQGNTTLNGLKTILEVGTNVNGRYWTVAVSSSAPITNDAFTNLFVMYYNPLAGSAFSRAATSATVTMTIAAPGVISWAAHLRRVGDPVRFTTTGALPTGLVAGVTYYVAAVLTSGTFTVAAALNGPPITTTGTQSGVHTCYSLGVVTVTEPGHKRQIGDSAYITGIPVGLDSFNGSYIISAVIAGISWSYMNLGQTEVGTGTANIQSDTAIALDISYADYDAANNIFSQLGAVNVTLGNLANSRCTFHQLVGGRSRAMQVFNGGRALHIPKMISSSASGASSKGTLQIESYAGEITVDYVEQNGSTDDCIAWGITTPVAPFGATASPSGVVNLGTLKVGKIHQNSILLGACLKIFSTVDNVDLGGVRVDDMDGTAGSLTMQNLAGLTCTMKYLHIGTMRNVPNVGTDQALINNWLRINSLRIDHLYDQAWQSTKFTMNFGTTTVGDFHIGSLVMNQNRASEIGIIFNSGTVIENFTTDSADIVAQNGYAAVRVSAGATIQNANHNNTRYNAASIFTGDFYNCNSGGTVQTLNVNNYKGNNRSIYAAAISGSGTAVDINVSNATVACIMNDGGTNQSGTVRLSNVRQGTNGANMLSPTGSGTWRVEGVNVDHQTGFFCQLTTGAASVSVNCRDAKIDMGANAGAPPARLVPLAGDQVFNTNAVGAGTYGRTNAGAWQLLY